MKTAQKSIELLILLLLMEHWFVIPLAGTSGTPLGRDCCLSHMSRKKKGSMQAARAPDSSVNSVTESISLNSPAFSRCAVFTGGGRDYKVEDKKLTMSLKRRFAQINNHPRLNFTDTHPRQNFTETAVIVD